MLHVHDLRETRVYQEAKEEGIREGIDQERQRYQQESHQEKLLTILKLAAMKMSAEDIADVLGLEVKLVRQEIAKTQASGTDSKPECIDE